MNIGIIGAGRVGVSIGKYLKTNILENRLKKEEYNIRGYFSKTIEHAKTAADFTNTKYYENLKELVSCCDVIFITTQDENIKNVWKDIVDFDLSNKLVCHFSGVLSSSVFEGIEAKNAVGMSIHPMYAFSDKFNSYKNLNDAAFVIEAKSENINPIEEMFKKLGHTVYKISPSNKAKYHAAAALASNHMIALFENSLELLKECGLKKSDARLLLTPLVHENINNMLKNGCENSLTGPISRNDTNTVKLHIEALKDNAVLDTYKETAKTLIDISKRKMSDNDYTIMESILK